MSETFIVQIKVKNDELTRDAGPLIAEILYDVLAQEVIHATKALPWVLAVEVNYAPSH